MEKVTGIGGIFFRAKDPAAVAQWYGQHLGINLAPTNMEMTPWVSTEGVTVFSPFAQDTDYFPPDHGFMLNFRVADLGKMLNQLRKADIEISQEQTMDGVGRFARIHDLEGNPVELWEPTA
ncbi:Glyoxalase-like domain protein [Pseudovibrio sp. W64]|uniref:VOC family protein n=1 Tax=unclassified Pseudovibrio TaxID=2627060 RepID=UPI0007AE6553|nr:MULTISPECIES: VOC family protein [unclassified Pseudovibrio]KZK87838.1 Glyoxalase-like domain protein [Pseudovibrio sp. W64]KZK88380.1 Glyoxalase-like domain protein [Pseudovibrio sp. Ad46]